MGHQNSAKERDLKATLSPRIAEILKGKKLWLLDSLIRASGHEDVHLVEDIQRGFDLTGSLPRSGVFSQKFGPASMTCEDLKKGFRPRSRGPLRHCSELWRLGD